MSEVGSLLERLRADLTAAMRARDEAAKAALRAVITGISKAEASGKAHTTLSDDEIVGIVRAEIKKRREAAEIYAQAARDELAARELQETEVLAGYLPEEIDDEELSRIVEAEVARARADGHDGPRAMGRVIKAVRDEVGVRAEGGRIAQTVKAALT